EQPGQVGLADRLLDLAAVVPLARPEPERALQHAAPGPLVALDPDRDDARARPGLALHDDAHGVRRMVDLDVQFDVRVRVAVALHPGAGALAQGLQFVAVVRLPDHLREADHRLAQRQPGADRGAADRVARAFRDGEGDLRRRSAGRAFDVGALDARSQETALRVQARHPDREGLQLLLDEPRVAGGEHAGAGARPQRQEFVGAQRLVV